MSRDPSEMDAPLKRPAGKQVTRDETVHVRLTAEALSKIDALAEQEERSRSDMIRVLIRRGWTRS